MSPQNTLTATQREIMRRFQSCVENYWLNFELFIILYISIENNGFIYFIQFINLLFQINLYLTHRTTNKY